MRERGKDRKPKQDFCFGFCLCFGLIFDRMKLLLFNVNQWGRDEEKKEIEENIQKDFLVYNFGMKKISSKTTEKL